MLKMVFHMELSDLNSDRIGNKTL